MRKPVFGVSDMQVRCKPGCTDTEERLRLEILDLGNRGIVLTMLPCSRSVQLICAFVFEYAKSRFSHHAAHMTQVFIQ